MSSSVELTGDLFETGRMVIHEVLPVKPCKHVRPESDNANQSSNSLLHPAPRMISRSATTQGTL